MEPGDNHKLRRLALHEGWEVLERVLAREKAAATQRLTEANFTDLLEVGRLQGKIATLQWVVSIVNTRLDRRQPTEQEEA